MSKFSFTSPDGKRFEVVGPPGATVEQAREIFNRQVNTGSLVGLVPGQVVSAFTQLSGGLTAATAQLSRLTTPVATQLDLSDTVLNQVLDAAKFVQQPAPNFSLGPLNSTDLQGLLAQTQVQTAQATDRASAALGVGKFGLDVGQLESTGFVKPGTAESLSKSAAPTVAQSDIDEAERINAEGGDITAEQVARNRRLNSFLTPGAFTGKGGVSSLKDVLTDSRIQDKIQGDVLKQSYQQLTQLGIPEQLPDPKALAGVLQTAATFDVKTAENFVKGLDIKNIAAVKSVAKAAEYAKAFAAKFATLLSKGGPLETGIRRPQGVSNTVDRSTVNASVTAILGNAKIPTPSFSPIAASAIAATPATSVAAAPASVSTQADSDSRRASTVVGGVTITAILDRELDRTGAEAVVILERNGVQEFAGRGVSGVVSAAIRLQNKTSGVGVDAIINWANAGLAALIQRIPR